ncbi:zf-HC2 domain-containing protein [Micromonospora sp. NPDC051296]|uniref:zf-HC2 domain-containing protein n=1 Tax=Micromonospora sp. NPDC051296 TaxID=3155046 RepID=UPI00341380A4
MRAGGDHATADQERLALYLMGALDDAERESFEQHLAGCWHCLDEAAEIGPSISGLAGLGDVEWSQPSADPPVPAPSPAADPVVPESGAADSMGAHVATPGSSGGAPPASDNGARSVTGAGRAADGGARSGTDDGPARVAAGSHPAGRRPAGARPGTKAGSRRRRALWAGAAPTRPARRRG